MKVSELIEKLQGYNQDLEVIADFYSDYDLIKEVKILWAVPKDGYIMREHRSMTEENKAKLQAYLYLE